MNTNEDTDMNNALSDIITNERYVYVLGLDSDTKTYLKSLISKRKDMMGGLPTLNGTRLWVYNILRDFIYDEADNAWNYTQYDDFVNACFLYVDEHLNDFANYFDTGVYTDNELFVN